MPKKLPPRHHLNVYVPYHLYNYVDWLAEAINYSRSATVQLLLQFVSQGYDDPLNPEPPYDFGVMADHLRNTAHAHPHLVTRRYTPHSEEESEPDDDDQTKAQLLESIL